MSRVGPSLSLLLSLALWSSTSVADAISFEATLDYDGPNSALTRNEDGDTEDMEVVRTRVSTRVVGYASGDNLKIVYVDSNDPKIHIGSWMLTTDGGAKWLLVNPENKTYAKGRFDGFGRATSAVGKKLGSWLKAKPKDLLVERAGGPDATSTAGVSGNAHRFAISYSTKNVLPGSKAGAQTRVDHDLVTVEGSALLASWLNLMPPSTGDVETDAEIVTSYGLGTQVALSSRATVTTGNDAETIRHAREVTSWSQGAIADSEFEIPADYKKTNRLWSRIKPGEGGLKGIFKKSE